MMEELEKLGWYFETNKDNWIRKEKLTMLLGLPNHQIRVMISELRKQGLTIISIKNKGYKLTTDINEIIAYADNELTKLTKQMMVYKKWKKQIIQNQNLKLELKVEN